MAKMNMTSLYLCLSSEIQETQIPTIFIFLCLISKILGGPNARKAVIAFSGLFLKL